MSKKETKLMEELLEALRRIEKMHRDYDPMSARGITAEIARQAIEKATRHRLTGGA